MTPLPTRRRHRRPNNIMNISFWLALLSLILPTVTSQLCEPLYDNTWEALREAIDFSYDFAILCPFRITGKGCSEDKEGYQVQYQDLFIMCETYFGRGEESSCVIDCPGTHFTVFPQAALTLDGITLQGSTNSAVRVKPTASFTSYSSNFKDNTNQFGNGGAIDAAPESRVTLMYSSFTNNQALNGGALYHRGRALIKGTKFYDNVATNGGGGAIFSGAQSETGLVRDLFQGNRASFFGPAVFDGSGATSTREANTACGNTLGGSSSVVCDGVYVASLGAGQCNPFEFECIAPTMSPTTSLEPSSSPRPSAEPSDEPSMVPSSTPTAEPSLEPTAEPTTLRPTGTPSQQPSTASPTAISTTMAPFSTAPTTTEPSASPTIATSSIAPTTTIPTASPTRIADSINGATPSPSSQQPVTPDPSIAPSLKPTENPTPSVTRTPTTEPTFAPTTFSSSSPSLRGTASNNSPGGKRH